MWNSDVLWLSVIDFFGVNCEQNQINKINKAEYSLQPKSTEHFRTDHETCVFIAQFYRMKLIINSLVYLQVYFVIDFIYLVTTYQ